MARSQALTRCVREVCSYILGQWHASAASGPSAARARAVWTERLEPRLLFTAVPYVAAPSSAAEGAAYTLDLHANGAAVDHWSVDWGDGTTANPDVQTVSGTATTATHVYTVTSGTVRPLATAVAANGATTPCPLGFDPTFGSDGHLHIAQGASAVAIQPDGKVVAVTSQGLRRYNTNGSADATFGTNGIAPLPGSFTADFNLVTIGTNGEIAVGGTDAYSTEFIIGRYSASGSLLAHGLMGLSAATATGLTYQISPQGHHIVLVGYGD